MSNQQPQAQEEISNYEMSFDDFEKISDLHESPYGITSLYRNPSNSQKIAVKKYYQSTENQGTNSTFNREVSALINLKNPCIIPIIGFSSPTSSTPPKIATLYAENGSLSNVLRQIENGERPSYVNDTWLAKTITRIVLGMKFIHSKKWIHRDLKPSNILIDDQYRPLISDLGSSKFVDSGVTLTHMVGTPLYMAPEMYEEGEYTSKIDVYSFSLILYEILVGRPVFPRNIQPGPLMRQVLNGTRPEIPETIVPEIREIISNGWDVNPYNRPSFEDIYMTIRKINYKITPNVDSDEVLASIDDLIPKVNVNILLWDKSILPMQIRYDDFIYDIRKKISQHTHFPVEEIILGHDGIHFAGCCWNCNNFGNFSFESAFQIESRLQEFLQNPVIELMMQVHATVKNYPLMPGKKHDGNMTFFFIRPSTVPELISRIKKNLWFCSNCHCKYLFGDTEITDGLVFNITHSPVFGIDIYFQWDCDVSINGTIVECNLDDPAKELLWRYIILTGKKINRIPYLTKIGEKIDLNKTLRQLKIINHDVLRCEYTDSDHKLKINVNTDLFVPLDLQIRDLPIYILLATRNWMSIKYMRILANSRLIDKESLETIAEAELHGIVNVSDINAVIEY